MGDGDGSWWDPIVDEVEEEEAVVKSSLEWSVLMLLVLGRVRWLCGLSEEVVPADIIFSCAGLLDEQTATLKTLGNSG